MNVYNVSGSGMNTTGVVTVVANDAEAATCLANSESRRLASIPGNPDYDLTYHTHNTTLLVGLFGIPEAGHRHAKGRCAARVVAMKEWGLPELPSKGSGIKVTF